MVLFGSARLDSSLLGSSLRRSARGLCGSLMLFSSLSLAMVGCAADVSGSEDGLDEDLGASAEELSRSCRRRTGGALITFANPEGTSDGEDEITLWITDSAFIDQAIEHQRNGTWQVAVFGEVIRGRDCDTKRWHVDPTSASWADFSIEECDGTITYITENLRAWTSRPNPNWCPWGGRVVRVIDRR